MKNSYHITQPSLDSINWDKLMAPLENKSKPKKQNPICTLKLNHKNIPERDKYLRIYEGD